MPDLRTPLPLPQNTAQYYDVMSEGIFALSRLLPMLTAADGGQDRNAGRPGEGQPAGSTSRPAVSTLALPTSLSELLATVSQSLVALSHLASVLELLLEKAVLTGLLGDGQTGAGAGAINSGREMLRINIVSAAMC